MPNPFMPAAEALDKVRMSFVQWLYNVEAERHDWYANFRDYYDGDHETQLTDRMAAYLQVKSDEEFNANYCPIVVDALAERLIVTGFTCDDEAQAELFGQWWAVNRMDAMQGIVHTATVRDGDAYVLVEWNEQDGRPVFSYELAFDGTEGAELHYEDERNKPVFASKRWRVKVGNGTGHVRRLNVYFPDRIEKYWSDQDQFEGAWQQYHEDGQPWPIPWVNRQGAPLGIPLVHFKNADEGYNYGQSELRSVVPLQNALNKSLIDLLAAADTTAFRIFWMLGDDPSALKVAPGSWVYSERHPGGDSGASVGFFPGEDLSPLIALKDSFAIEVARTSRTPLSYFQISGQRAAEGTLKQEESGLLAKIAHRQTSFGNAWEDVLSMARRLANVYGSGSELDETAIITTQWAPAATRDDKIEAEVAQIKAGLGVPQEQLWSELGYSAADIERMLEMKQREQAESQKLLSQALLQAEREFNAGPATETQRTQRGLRGVEPPGQGDEMDEGAEHLEKAVKDKFRQARLLERNRDALMR